jgi:hypothetical protein
MWTRVDGQTWTLHWFLFEVVRDEIVHVALFDELVTVSADPPTALDVSRLTRLRATASGDAEFAILAGPNARRERIETDAERQLATEQAREADELKRRREAALGPEISRSARISVPLRAPKPGAQSVERSPSP